MAICRWQFLDAFIAISVVQKNVYTLGFVPGWLNDSAHLWLTKFVQLFRVKWIVKKKTNQFLAALAALYPTLVSQSLSGCHFRISTQKVTFETWNPSDIWLEWYLDKKTIRQNDKKTKTKKIKTKKRVYYCDVRAVSHSCRLYLASTLIHLKSISSLSPFSWPSHKATPINI